MDSKISQMFFKKKKRNQMYHSKGYHRYFDGYIERKVTDENGKIRIKRIYTGTYYRQNLSDKQWVWRKIQYLLIYFVTAVLYLYAGTRIAFSNSVWYGVLPQIAANLGLVGLLAVLICYAGAPRDMKKRTYYAAVLALKKLSLYNTVTLAAAALAAALCLVIYYDGNRSVEFGIVTSYIFGSVGMFWIYRTENRIKYLQKQSAEKAVPEDYRIEY